MEKGLLISTLCALLLIAGCSQQPENSDPWKPGTVRFVITAGTPATRAFYSEETIDPAINDVKVYVFRNDEDDDTEDYLYLKTIPITGWTNAGVTLTLENENVLAPGDYKFLAVGHVEGNTWTTLPLSLTPETTFEEIYVHHVYYMQEISDIYAGNTALSITSRGAQIGIDMTRKVAGFLGYFSNVPQFVGETEVKMICLSIMEGINTDVYLSDGRGDQIGTALPYHIIQILLTEEVEDGIYVGNDVPDDGIEQLPNSYLMGRFAIPQQDFTMTLGLYESSGDDPIISWPVNNGDLIDIAANNLYRLGVKKEAGNTNGGTDDDPSDDDDTIDITALVTSSFDQELTITISPEWDGVTPIM